MSLLNFSPTTNVQSVAGITGSKPIIAAKEQIFSELLQSDRPQKPKTPEEFQKQLGLRGYVFTTTGARVDADDSSTEVAPHTFAA